MWLKVILLIATYCHFSEAFNLTIVHGNDFHSHFSPINELGGACSSKLFKEGKCFGGIARNAYMINELVKNEHNVLNLNAGDYFQGTVWYSFFKAEIIGKFVPLLNHHAVALGNHEFDDGVEGLLPYLNLTSPLPILACNLDVSQEPRLQNKFKNSIILTVEDKKIAIIGYITPETIFSSSPGDTVSFTDEIVAIKEEIKRIKQSYDIDIFIGLGHSGILKDEEIARAIPELDIIVGGHSHTFLYTGTPPSNDIPVDKYPVVITHNDGSKTLVVQAFCFGKYLGKLDVEFDNEGNVAQFSGNPILLSQNIPEDESIAQIVAKYQKQLDVEYKKKVGESKVFLDATKCRIQECNLGNLITDAWVDYFIMHGNRNKSGWTDLPVAIYNGGGVRTSIDELGNEGVITKEDLISVIPFANNIISGEMPGHIVRQALEWSVAHFDYVDQKGKFLQYSGIKVVYDFSKPDMQRVVSAKIRCGDCRVPKYEPLDENKIYKIIFTQYLAKGGDNYTMFNSPEVKTYEYGYLDFDCVVEYVQRKSPITQGLEARITILNGDSIQKR